MGGINRFLEVYKDEFARIRKHVSTSYNAQKNIKVPFDIKPYLLTYISVFTRQI